MSRKLKNLLKNIPDVIELKVDEEEIAKDLKKELMAHGLDKGTAIDISQEIASGFIYKYVQNLFIRKDLSLDKKKIEELFELLAREYLRLNRQLEESQCQP